jgi:hypothetical protein
MHPRHWSGGMALRFAIRTSLIPSASQASTQTLTSKTRSAGSIDQRPKGGDSVPCQ